MNPTPPAMPDLDAGKETALRTLRNAEFLLSRKYQEQQWRAVRAPADRRIIEFERLLVRRFKALGIPMFCHCMVRTVAQQRQEMAEGNSWTDDPTKGAHVLGRAIDVVHSIRGWDLTFNEWAMIGHIGKEVAKSVKWTERHPEGHLIEHVGIHVEWGGDWKRWDPAHWELEGE
jgi:hypothetical protein